MQIFLGSIVSLCVVGIITETKSAHDHDYLAYNVVRIFALVVIIGFCLSFMSNIYRGS